MLKINLLWPGKTKERWLQVGLDFYLKKLGNYYQVKVINTKTARGKGKKKDQLIESEALFLKKALPARGFHVALDANGKMYSSKGLAKLVKELEERGLGSVSFMIGGAYGISRKLLNECDLCLSLSKMTFTHEMSRLILVEQLYRAASINAGSPYHH